MYASFLIYSFSSILSKLAACQEFLSPLYMICFGGIIVIMAIYAIVWQQVLKNIPLSVAMANKPLVIVFSLFWAVIIFKETVSLKMLAGIVLIICGIFIIGRTANGK